jgi:hypothetical protein
VSFEKHDVVGGKCPGHRLLDGHRRRSRGYVERDARRAQ